MVLRISKYLQYFFYLGWNWNFRLAFVILYHEIKGERKYGIDTIGTDDLTGSVSGKDLKHASIYQPVNYYIGEWLFSKLHMDDVSGKSFLDAGCGKGRAMIMAAAKGYNQVYGIDISPKMCHETIRNIQKVQQQYPGTAFDVQCMDAKQADIPSSIAVIFLFNPFNKEIMKPFIENVMKSLAEFPRHLKVLYANPECLDLWESAGFKVIHKVKKLKWLQGVVLEFRQQ